MRDPLGAHLVDDLEVEGDGLLAEDGLAGLRGLHDLRGVLLTPKSNTDKLVRSWARGVMMGHR
jgi:hypothetical protein